MSRPRTPLLAVDVIIELVDRSDHPIVLIERRNPPFGWTLPGGFVDVGERLEQAAVREAKEETCLDVTLRSLLGCYSDPGRDPRSHTVSIVYVAQSRGQPYAADDAKNLGVFSLDALPAPLAFDHAMILTDYRRFRETGEPTSVTPGADGHSER
jgi:8-oxo-dGTP diphosphatase